MFSPTNRLAIAPCSAQETLGEALTRHHVNFSRDNMDGNPIACNLKGKGISKSTILRSIKDIHRRRATPLCQIKPGHLSSKVLTLAGIDIIPEIRPLPPRLSEPSATITPATPARKPAPLAQSNNQDAAAQFTAEEEAKAIAHMRKNFNVPETKGRMKYGFFLGGVDQKPKPASDEPFTQKLCGEPAAKFRETRFVLPNSRMNQGKAFQLKDTPTLQTPFTRDYSQRGAYCQAATDPLFHHLGAMSEAATGHNKKLIDAECWHRFQDIPCFGSTALKAPSGFRDILGQDYRRSVHANHLPFQFRGNGHLIASQAHGTESYKQFLLSLLDQKVTTVVDLLGVAEKAEMHKHYAHLDHSLEFADHSTLTQSGALAEKVLDKPWRGTTLNMRYEKYNQCLLDQNIDYLNYYLWPDKDVADEQDLYLLAQDVHDRVSHGEQVVIHCRAGVGRTGALASLVAFMEQLDRTPASEINQAWVIEAVGNIVLEGRQARGPAFVQTERQFHRLMSMSFSLATAKIAGLDYHDMLRKAKD